MFKISVIILTLFCNFSIQLFAQIIAKAPEKPNIVIIYLDDLGYGDLSCYGATDIQTPNIDALAKEGVRFTNGYATSATCTPSRYGLLTGQYPWRNKNAKILPGTAPLLLSTTQQTIPKMLQKEGYQTAVIGKWHLGLGSGHTDWNKKITPGPKEVGFDESYIMAATQDRVPTVYIKNGIVDNLQLNDPISVDYDNNFEGEPTAISNPELLTMNWHHGHNNSIVNGIPRIGFMKGGKTAIWNDTEMAANFLTKAQDYVRTHKDKPFFLYFAMHQPHVPRTPSAQFVGKSGLGSRGDVILEADWCIGEFMKTLKKEGILENTLVVFTSDNGPVLNDGYVDNAVEKTGDHKFSGNLRGGKYSLYEGGTRIPFITYWKGKIQPGVSDAIVCQLDLLASFATLVGEQEINLDSKDYLSVFLGKSSKGRTNLILEADGKTALRQENWLLIPPYNGPAFNKSVGIELGNSKEYQLFDLKKDIGQQHNLAPLKKKELEECIAIYKKLKGAE